MGLFSSSKKTYVSSVAYNLAGDVNLRPNYLKTSVFGYVMSDRDSLAASLTNDYLTGPAIKLRSFARWAVKSRFNNSLGLRSTAVLAANSIDWSVVASQIPAPPNTTISPITVEIGLGDYTVWAEKYMSENHPDLAGGSYGVDYFTDTNEILITVDNQEFRFHPVGFDVANQYIYCSYTADKEGVLLPLETGNEIAVSTESGFPSTSGWTLVSNQQVDQSIVLTRTVTTVVSYSDSRPNEVSVVETDQTVTRRTGASSYKKIEYKGVIPGQQGIGDEHSYLYINKQPQKSASESTSQVEEEIEDGVVKTTTTTTRTESVDLVGSYRIDTQILMRLITGKPSVFIYGKGQGNPVLDALFNPSSAVGDFLPFIPVRIDNRFLSDSFLPDIYTKSKKATKKALGTKYGKIVDLVADNPSLSDIDYCYAMFGCSLNIVENKSRAYLYQFFRSLMISSGSNLQQYKDYKRILAEKVLEVEKYNEWLRDQENGGPLYGEDPPPLVIQVPSLPESSISHGSYENPYLNYDITISWIAIEETTHTGKFEAGAKKNTYKLVAGSSETVKQPSKSFFGNTFLRGSNRRVDTFYIHWQEKENSFRTLEIVGAMHRNAIYGGKSVDIYPIDALNDPEESGFIVPLSEGIFKGMRLLDSTQMCTANSYLVFNCYQVVKKKWYQKGIFKVVIVIAAIAISVYTGGTGVGLLGSSAQIGATLGFTGVAALVVGAVANALAAIILTKIISSVSVTLLGDKIGALIGAIASFAALQVGTAMMNNQSLSSLIGQMSRAENILKLVSAVGKGYQGYIQASVKELAEMTQQVMEDYKTEKAAIDAAYQQNLASTGVDILEITQAVEAFYESPESFLSRTLMTGEDVCDMSMNLIYNFAEITLSLDLEG